MSTAGADHVEPADGDPRTVAAQRLGAHGLAVRGALDIDVGDRSAPVAPDGRPARAVILVGNVGPDMWAHFSRDRDRRGEAHPLDRWSRAAIAPVAAALEGWVAMPSDGPPYPPFLRWAARAEPVHPSPIGPLIHERHGLWHAYRGAILLEHPLRDAGPGAATDSPCERCAARPCLTTCPVDAFDARTGYDVDRCAAHLASPAGRDCLTGGCLARRSCPVSPERTYPPEQFSFHMRAFLRARRLAGRA